MIAWNSMARDGTSVISDFVNDFICPVCVLIESFVQSLAYEKRLKLLRHHSNRLHTSSASCINLHTCSLFSKLRIYAILFPLICNVYKIVFKTGHWWLLAFLQSQPRNSHYVHHKCIYKTAKPAMLYINIFTHEYKHQTSETPCSLPLYGGTAMLNAATIYNACCCLNIIGVYCSLFKYVCAAANTSFILEV